MLHPGAFQRGELGWKSTIRCRPSTWQRSCLPKAPRLH